MLLVREIKVSKKASSFTESVIRDMTRLAIKHNAINLAQGFPDFAAPQEIKEAAKRAIDADINQYAITWGAKPFRDAMVAAFPVVTDIAAAFLLLGGIAGHEVRRAVGAAFVKLRLQRVECVQFLFQH